MNVVKLYSDERGFDQAKFVGEREVAADKRSAGRKTSADIAEWSESDKRAKRAFRQRQRSATEVAASPG